MALVALLSVPAGCDDPEDVGVGSGGDAGDAGGATSDAGVYLPEAPTSPALPALTPCPEGWRVVADDETAPGLERCDPWPATGRAACADDEAQFVGGTGCEVVGTPCGDGDWATDLPPDENDIVFAKAGAVGGDGLRDTPYGDLQLAIDTAIDRGAATVALSKGTFDGRVHVTRPVTLWGACTAETILTRTERPQESLPIVEVAVRGPITIRNLTVAGAQLGIDVYDLDGTLILDAVVLRVKDVGVYVRNAVVDATNLVVRDTMASDEALSGYGVAVLEAGSVTLTRVVLSGNRSSAVSADGEGTELVVRDAALLDTLPEEASGFGGSGLEARSGAHAIVERVAVEGAVSGGLVCLDGSVLEATDVTIRDVAPAHEVGGHGVVVGLGGRLVGRRIDVTASAHAGVAFDGVGVTGELEDLVVTDTRIAGLGDGAGDGIGLVVAGGAVVDAHRVLVARNVDSGLAVGEPGSRFVADDVTVLDTTAGAGASGTAFSVAPGGHVELTRFHSSRSVGASVIVLGSLQMVDALVETTAEGAVLADGWGLAVSSGGEVDLERAILRDHHGLGVVAYQGGRLTGSDVLIEDIRSAAGAASGVVGIDEGILALTRFVVSRAEVCGVQVAQGGEVDLDDGEVRDNPIGANVQDVDFDLARIQDGVRYLDNGISLDTSRLPLPDVDR